MIGESAWSEYARCRSATVRAVLWCSAYGGEGMAAVKVPTPGQVAIHGARFGLSVYPNQEAIYPQGRERVAPDDRQISKRLAEQMEKEAERLAEEEC